MCLSLTSTHVCQNKADTIEVSLQGVCLLQCDRKSTWHNYVKSSNLFRCRLNAVCTFRHILKWLRRKQLWMFTWSMSFHSSLLGAYTIWTGTFTWRVGRVIETVHQEAMVGRQQSQGTWHSVASIENRKQNCGLQHCQEVQIKAIPGKEGLVDETYLQQVWMFKS